MRPATPLIALALLACGPAPAGPCADDPLGCSQGGEFRLDPGCRLRGPLEVELGRGREGFTPFGDGPEVHFGAQGGRHVFLSLRVGGLDLVRYPLFRATLIVDAPQAPARCKPPGSECFWNLATREIVMGDELPISANAAGDAVVDSLTIILNDVPPPATRFLLRVEDMCGRLGEDLRLSR